MKLALKFLSTLVLPLVLISVAVAYLSQRSLSQNAEVLTKALKIDGDSKQILALLQQQEQAAQMEQMKRQLAEMAALEKEISSLKQTLPQAIEVPLEDTKIEVPGLKGAKPRRSRSWRIKRSFSTDSQKLKKKKEQPPLERPRGMVDDEWEVYQILCGVK